MPCLTDLQYTNYSKVTRCIRSVCCQTWEGPAFNLPKRPATICILQKSLVRCERKVPSRPTLNIRMYLGGPSSILLKILILTIQ